MDKQALASAIAGGAITAALIETLFDKGVLTLDEARAILNSAMRSISPYVQEGEAAFEASQIIGGLLRGKFSARSGTP
jgi:polyhydroxyalkanoate synthesis regulator phasin